MRIMAASTEVSPSSPRSKCHVVQSPIFYMGELRRNHARQRSVKALECSNVFAHFLEALQPRVTRAWAGDAHVLPNPGIECRTNSPIRKEKNSLGDTKAGGSSGRRQLQEDSPEFVKCLRL